MSRETYARGFAKAAQANGVDPHALAQFVKKGFSLADAAKFLDDVKAGVKKTWNNVPVEYKPLVGGLAGGTIGAGTGAIAGKLLGSGAGRGALAGLGIGGVGGSLLGAKDAGKERKALMKAVNDSWNEDMESERAKHESQMADIKKRLEIALGKGFSDAELDKLTPEQLKAVHGALNANISAAKGHLDAVSKAMTIKNNPFLKNLLETGKANVLPKRSAVTTK